MDKRDRYNYKTKFCPKFQNCCFHDKLKTGILVLSKIMSSHIVFNSEKDLIAKSMFQLELNPENVSF